MGSKQIEDMTHEEAYDYGLKCLDDFNRCITHMKSFDTKTSVYKPRAV